nr:photosystem I subunit VIII [Calystegia hederacea]WQF68902.1 photosystem I subunit VIII [Calystegia hederacea]
MVSLFLHVQNNKIV